ncbi:MAG: hypothetical protein D6753_07590 [Planctomycetota bacterium]|nr:MAG: hypothetical protein D6753_07590 [Planctomycetota bacterium]
MSTPPDGHRLSNAQPATDSAKDDAGTGCQPLEAPPGEHAGAERVHRGCHHEEDTWSTAGTWRQLDPRSIAMSRIVGAIAATVLTILALVGVATAWLTVSWPLWGIGALLCLAMVVVAIGWIVAWWWPPLAFRHARWRLDAAGLEIYRGVLWRHRIAIPAHRVQHVDVAQGPMQRMFDLGTLIVHTAGTQHASVELSGLNHGEAMRLRDLLIEFRGGNDVV